MDRFERVRKIGEGSFGKALLVKQKDSGKLLVVKEISISKVNINSYFLSAVCVPFMTSCIVCHSVSCATGCRVCPSVN